MKPTRLAVQWALDERHAAGDSILLYSPGRNNTWTVTPTSANSRQSRLCRAKPGGRCSAAAGGIVIALWPDQQHLHKIDEHHGTTALVALTWNEREVRPWARAKDATALGSSDHVPASSLHPVVAAAVGSMSAGITQGALAQLKDRVERHFLALEERRRPVQA